MEINGILYESNGIYIVVEKENGMTLLTENAGKWVLNGDDLRIFETGKIGIYYTERNTETPYILTDKNRLFYITDKEVLADIKRKTLKEEEDRAVAKNAVEHPQTIGSKGEDAELLGLAFTLLSGSRKRSLLNEALKAAKEAKEEASWEVAEAKRGASKFSQDVKPCWSKKNGLIAETINPGIDLPAQVQAPVNIAARTCTFYPDVGAGYVNSRTGEFHPK
jgi:hypothetical protein